jgi:multidrug efflux pump subunit AcrA (membrane-fusion protein)
MKRTIIILIVVALAGLGAFRAAQVISARKNEEPRKGRMGQAPLVEVAPVTQGLIEEKIIRTGDIVPEAQVTIYSKVQGWVEKINVREGDRIKAGQVLATLDTREAEAAVAQSKASLEAAAARLKQVKATSEEAIQAQIQQTKANLELAESDLKRARELHEKNFIARQQLDEARTKYNVAKATYDLALNNLRQRTWENDIALAEAQVRQAKATLDLTQAQLANLIILSPMNGGVTKRYVDPGTMVKDTTPILTLMDLSEVKMLVNVIEREFVHLQKGQAVKVTVTAFPNRTFQGRISVITPALELQSRTAEIQISIPNPGYILNPGMFGRAEILLRSNPGALVIPIQALVNEGDRDLVYIYKDGNAHHRVIRKGLVKDTQVEVMQGLNVGEQVITAGHGFLKDGMPVRLPAPSAKADKKGSKP